MKLTKAKLKQIIKEEIDSIREDRDAAATEYELYASLQAISKDLQQFKDDLDFSMGLTSGSPRTSQISEKVYEMIRKGAYAMELARNALAQEIGQDPHPELASVRQED
jgi:acyl-CoA reductase-like NAD-dependent aldehyde dehydrogenase